MTPENQIPRIASLPGGLINQIAAGEVIERPASVVKELVENAIDARASRIEVEVTRGGTEKIIVRDNGHGIHPEDMELAILRHSTSKLRDQSGLARIASLGFRGEALSSIASVADFTMTSRIAAIEHATKLVFDPYTGKHETGPAAMDSGTSVEVSRLFQPVPARRKFLRSDKTEFLHIQEIMKRFALCRLDIDFQFSHNGKLVLNSPASTNRPDRRIEAIIGKVFGRNSWPVEAKVEDLAVWGRIGGERAARNQSDQQYLFLNGRIIRDRHISHAIRQAMESLIPVGRFPAYCLYLWINVSSVDINVHPTKQEVRFRNPRNLHDFIYAAIHEAVKQQSLESHDDSTSGFGEAGLGFNRPASWNSVHAIKDIENSYGHAESNRPVAGETALGIPLAVLYGKYLVTRHAREYRLVRLDVLERKYLHSSLERDLVQRKVVNRPIMVPVTLKIDERSLDSLMTYKESLDGLGITIEQSGPGTLSVRSIPALLPDLDIKVFFQGLENLKPVDNKCSQTDKIINLMLDATIDDGKIYQLSTELQSLLIKWTSLDLPYRQRQFLPVWSTLTENSIKSLFNGSQH